MRPIIVLVLAALSISFSSCKKDPGTTSGGNQLKLGATTVDSVSYRYARITSAVLNTGGNTCSRHGHCWSADPKPDLADAYSDLGPLNGALPLTSSLAGLVPGTKYYLRAYFQVAQEIVYFDAGTLTTLALKKPSVVSLDVVNVTVSGAECRAEVVDDGGDPVTMRGFCWSTDTLQGLSLRHFSDTTCNGPGLGLFTGFLTSLAENKGYFVRAYAVNSVDTAYGKIRYFTTTAVSLPTVLTVQHSNITTTSFTCGGNVTNSGNGTVTSRGVCYSAVNPNPGFSDQVKYSGSGAGTFSVEITGLSQGTTCHYRAFAVNEKGTGYGEISSVPTLSISKPTVVTADASSVTSTSAKCGGTVTGTGYGTVSARGICWATFPNPTLANCGQNKMTLGSGAGSFTGTITGLTASTPYWVQAYATNEAGTAYGGSKSFTTHFIVQVTNLNTISGDQPSVSQFSDGADFTMLFFGSSISFEYDGTMNPRVYIWTCPSGIPCYWKPYLIPTNPGGYFDYIEDEYLRKVRIRRMIGK